MKQLSVIFVMMLVNMSGGAQSMKEQGYVNIKDVDPTIRVSLMYTRPDNFTGRVLYTDLKDAYLHPDAAQALKKCQQRLK